MKHSRGFSLMETLGALALLALVLLGVMTALQTLTKSTRSSLAVTQRLDQVRAAQMYLRRTLSIAVAYPWALDGPARPRSFAGTRDEVVFVAPGPGYLEASGLQLQSLRLLGEAGDMTLQVEFSPLASRIASPVVPGEPEVLLDHIKAGHFAYSGIDENGEPITWRDTWPYPNRLPSMVGVELELSGGVSWPTVAVPLRMDPTAINAREGLARLSGQVAK